jgi:hypothetical protein
MSVAKWAGRTFTAIPVLFLTLDIAMKLLRVPAAVQGTTQLGYPEGMLLPLGIVEAVAMVLYLVPRTAVFGAVLWTGYLGGAVATHVRISDPLLSHTLFPVYVAAMLWLGLWLRDPRVRLVLQPAATPSHS